jgi:hypothetical protein
MTAKQTFDLRELCSKLRCDCEAMLDGRMNPAQLPATLRSYEVHAKTVLQRDTPSSQGGEACDKYSKASLLAWAKDMRVQDFIQTRRVWCFPRKGLWRWIEEDERQSQVWALPTLRGTPRITDGVLCVLEKQDGSCSVVHLENLVKDAKTKATSSSRQAGKRTSRKSAEIQELLCDL